MSKNLKKVAVVQARMGSSRLPGKVLMELEGKPILGWLLDNLSTSVQLDAVVVATSDRSENQAIVEFCRERNTRCYVGSESDVLSRLFDAAVSENADILVRLTADNPLVTGDLVDLVLSCFDAGTAYCDYVHTIDGSGWPYGMAVEAVRVASLRESMLSSDPLDREHVTYFVRNRPNKYKHHVVKCPVSAKFPAVTIDTQADFDRVAEYVGQSGLSGPKIGYSKVLDTLSKHVGTNDR